MRLISLPLVTHSPLTRPPCHSPLVRLIAAPGSVKMRLAVWLVTLLNWIVPGLTYARLFSRQPIERGMNDQEAVKVSV